MMKIVVSYLSDKHSGKVLRYTVDGTEASLGLVLHPSVEENEFGNLGASPEYGYSITDPVTGHQVADGETVEACEAALAFEVQQRGGSEWFLQDLEKHRAKWADQVKALQLVEV